MKIELTAEHIHGTELKKPGDVIELTEDLAKWLIDLGKAKPAAEKKEKK